MTTAHRPTYHPAKGRADQGGNRFLQATVQSSARNQPSQLAMKVRQEGQGTEHEIKTRDLKAELEERERKAREEASKKNSRHESDYSRGREREQLRIGDKPPPPPEEEEKVDFSKEDADIDLADSSEEDSEEEDEDYEQLMAELERIKQERAAQEAKNREEAEAEEERIRQEEIVRGNPLLNLAGPDHTIKRRWDDDVVFRNTCKSEPEKKKRFINDTVRNDFHKRFLSKYIQ